MLVASVTAVLALALGWMIGRATSGEPDTVAEDAAETTRRTTTTLEAPRETLPIVGEEIPDVDPDEPIGSGTTPGITTTTVPPAPVTEAIAVDDRLAGVPMQLVGVELGGRLVEADLGAGALTDFGADRIVSDGNPLVVGTDWVVASPSNGRARVIWSDGGESALALGDYWRLLPVPGADRFWRGSFGPPTIGIGAFELVDLAGTPLGPVIEMPANSWPVLVDPRTGGVAVAVAGRSYVVLDEGVEHLADGQIVNLSEDVVVAYGCDEALVCSLSRTDRTTGEVTVVPPDPTLDEPLRWDSVADWGGADSSISPDGRWSAVIGSSWRSSVSGIVELASGRFVELTEISAPPTVVWSPDSRWAFYVDDLVPMAYDTVTDDRFPVFADLVQWIQLGARPSGDRAGGRSADGPTLLSAAPHEPIEG